MAHVHKFYFLLLLFVAELSAAIHKPDGSHQQVPTLFHLCARMFKKVTKEQVTRDQPVFHAILRRFGLNEICKIASAHDINILAFAERYRLPGQPIPRLQEVTLQAILDDPYLIHIAAAQNNIYVLQVADYYGISVNQPKRFMGVDWYPLYYAANRGHTQAIAELLRQDGDINQYSGLYTPLMVAAEKGDDATVELLLNSGANKRLRNTKDQSAYNLAANNGYANVLATLDNYR